MDYETFELEALNEMLHLVAQGVHEPLAIIKVKYTSDDTAMTEEQWNYFYQVLPTYFLEKAETEDVLKKFLADYSVLSNTVLETAAKNDDVPLEYVRTVLEKQQAELLVLACSQNSADLLNFLLEKDSSLANLKLLDGSFILHYAMQFGTVDIITTLLYYGAIATVEDNNGRNILHYAAMNKSDACWLRFSNDPKFARFLKRADCHGTFPQRA